MKITIAPTHDQSEEKFPYHSVTIESATDGGDINEALEIIHAALTAWGFEGECVTTSMNEFTP